MYIESPVQCRRLWWCTLWDDKKSWICYCNDALGDDKRFEKKNHEWPEAIHEVEMVWGSWWCAMTLHAYRNLAPQVLIGSWHLNNSLTHNNTQRILLNLTTGSACWPRNPITEAFFWCVQPAHPNLQAITDVTSTNSKAMTACDITVMPLMVM